MSSKDVIFKICEIANNKCKMHHVDDVDFTTQLSIIYCVGRWWLGIYDPVLKAPAYCYTTDIRTKFMMTAKEAPWHLEAVDRIVDAPIDISKKYMLPLFSNNIVDFCKKGYDSILVDTMLPLFSNNTIDFCDKGYDSILDKMLQQDGLSIILYAKDHDALCERYDKRHEELMGEIRQHWVKNKGSLAKAKQMLAEVNELDSEKTRVTEPEIELIPKGMHNVEELCIWLDLQL